MKIISSEMIRYNVNEIVTKEEMNELKILSCFFCNRSMTFDKLNLIHHANGNPLDNRKCNLITLCSSCHSKIHAISALLEDNSIEFDIIAEKEMMQLRNSRCSECGYLPDDEERRNHVHHINRNHFDNRRENLQTLCTTCHGKTRRGVKRKDENFLNVVELMKKVDKEAYDLIEVVTEKYRMLEAN